MWLVFAAPLLAALITLMPREGGALAVFTGVDDGHAMLLVARADGVVLRFTNLPGLVIARSDTPGFAGRLRAAGALFSLDALGAAGCALRPTRQNEKGIP